AHPDAEFTDFLEWVALRTDLDTLIEGERAVTLMTLHTAKGLEFPVVFVIGMEDGLFPHSNSMFEPKGLEEERRLAYVGITRAQERLYLTHAYQRTLYGANQYNAPSMFLGEIPEEHMRTEGVGSLSYERAAPTRGDRYTRSGWREPARTGSGERGGRVYGAGSPRTAPAEEPAVAFEVGDAVEHRTFGRGKVTAVKADRVTIRFKGDVGSKTLLVGFAPLRKV
ncbi:MAG TPA: 3'-5' exonuclease, partial [Coriobacteriia bacterium]